MPRKTSEPNVEPSMDELIIPIDEQQRQTDPVDAGEMPEETAEPDASSSDPQTGTENTDSGADLPEGSAVSQTDAETEANPESQDENQPPAQTETENSDPAAAGEPEIPAPKPKRTRKKAASQDDSAAQSQSDSGADESPPAKPARRRRRADPIVAIDEQRSVETHEDKMRNDLLDLVESLKGRKILTGTIQGIERAPDNPELSFAVLYHGELKVIIPATETVEPPDDFRDRLPGDVMHYLVTKRLGAEIDYIIKGIDQNSGIAAASRLEAMAMKRKEYYFGTDRDGNNLLYEGISAEARIVSVIRAGIFVDLFGVETYVPLRELSYQRWMDATAYFQPGQRVLVKILSIDRADRSKIVVQASVKQASENPYEKALRRYTIGSRYVGTVSMVDLNGVFVSLDGGIDCLCSYPKRGRPPRGARVTVRILGINHESNRIWGAITHMVTAR